MGVMAVDKNDLNNLPRLLLPCVRCGQCRSVCPVFLAKGVESDSPRGRMTLVRALLEGKLKPSDLLNEKLQQCLLCRTCVMECPSGVHVDRVIIAAREKLAEKKGIPLKKKVIARWLLPNLNRLAAFMPAAALLEGIVAVRVGGGYYRLRLNLPLVGKRLLPSVGGKRPEFLTSSTGGSFSASSAGRRVVFFTGCMTNMAYPRVAGAVVEVLRRHGVEVVIPKELVCCGLPMLASGDRESFLRVREENIKVFKKYPGLAIITACASCGSTLKEYYAGGIEGKVYDFTEFLLGEVDFQPPRGVVERKITYHDPCHLRKAQQIKEQPRRLLKSIPGVQYQEVKDPDRCCGFGGTFSLSFPDLSQKIGITKVQALMDTGADTVVTACPGCMLQLADGLYNRQRAAAVMHVAEVLAAAYRAEERQN